MADEMMSRRPIILVGLPGSGKSTIGKAIAARLGLKFIDSDAEIERETGMTIVRYFEVHGEKVFRPLEAEVISRLLETRDCVIALGGGAFLNRLTRSAVKSMGTSIWLDAPLDLIEERLKHSADRPLLNAGDRLQALQQLSKAREPSYREADIRIESVDQQRAVDEILVALRPWRRETASK